jgi:hypothetical protein
MTPELTCRDRHRNAALERAGLTALDEVDVEVGSGFVTLTLWFTGPMPEGIGIGNVRIDGGRPVTVTGVRAADGDPPTALVVTLAAPGDASTYTLRLVATGSTQPYPGLDPRQATATFTFTAGCPVDADCLPTECPPPRFTEPALDYLAKDYDSFRRLLLDRLTLLAPQWTERHVPDLGVTLVELLAYVGDQLSYRQDAVATEAYLDTARQRVSVRRHVRLIDYAMHDGCNARAWVCVQVSEALLHVAAEEVQFLAGALPGLAGPVLTPDQLAGVPVGSYEVFEVVAPRQLSWWPAHNAIYFWTWGDAQCCLPAGTTSAMLQDSAKDEQRLHLHPGDVLIFEEILGPRTGAAADAGPTHRQAVRLTRVTPGVDPVFDQPLVTVEWAREDALAFPLCVSSRGGPHCNDICDVSVAHGNVVLVDHGALITWCAGPSEAVDVPPAPVGSLGCPEPTGCVTTPDPVAAELATRSASCRGGTALSCDDLAALEKLVGAGPVARVGLGRQSTTDRCRVTPDDASIQADLLDQLAAQLAYPPLPVTFWPALAGRPVTQSAPYPGDAVVTRAQAAYLRSVPAAARDRLGRLRAAALDGHHLATDDLGWLRGVFGGATLRRVGLDPHPPTDPATQASALAWLLARFDELLAAKLDRLRGLARRAAAGRRLDVNVGWELTQSWGDAVAAGLAAAITAAGAPARDALTQDPRTCLPALTVTLPGDQGAAWVPRRDLLGSGPTDRHVVGEVDNDSVTHLRFGDDRYSAAPPPGSTLAAAYRVGNGATGNVAAEAITRVLFCSVRQNAVTGVRNPLPAAGGIDPEPVAQTRVAAPLAPGRQLRRAITAADYATLAEAIEGVQRAAAELRWNGSWYEATVGVDALGVTDTPEGLIDEVADRLHRVRRLGHDLVVTPATTVPIDLEVGICVGAQYLRAHVTAAVRAVLGTGVLPDGTRGMFHPDELTFGSPIRVSRIIARVAALAGVTSVEVTRLRRLFAPDTGALTTGVLTFGPLEIPRCDSDATHPDHGRLVITSRGGR